MLSQDETPVNPGENPPRGPGHESRGGDTPRVPADSLDSELEVLLSGIRPPPEWGVSAVAELARRVIDLLLISEQRGGVAGEGVAKGAFQLLATRLKRCGHRPDTVAGYGKELKLARAEAGCSSGPTRGGASVQYDAVTGGPDCTIEDPAEWGTYRVSGNKDEKLTNFCLFLDRHVSVEDGGEVVSRFEGRFVMGGVERPFSIRPEDYANRDRFAAALYAIGGPKLELNGSIDELRKAVGQLSETRQFAVTTAFGWDDSWSEYRVPGGVVGTAGFRSADECGGLRIDLSAAEKARFLDLKSLPPDRLAAVKRHAVEDLLCVHAPIVTRTLLAVCALAILLPFAGGANRFALWLRGRTGVGKSTAAKLFMNLFGDFPPASPRFASWNSTANSIQREGHNFKDAPYLVDDYKPDIVRHADVVRILQANADGSARGRLRADGTPNPGREIRGLLVCTGEDVPEHSASALARSVIVTVPTYEMDQDRLDRCVAMSGDYRGLTPDLIRFMLAGNWTGQFAELVGREQRRLHGLVVGRPNAARIAANHALLAVAFRVACEYLADAWPGALAVAENYAAIDLPLLLDQAVSGSASQSPGEVLIAVLSDLVENRRIRIEGWRHNRSDEPTPPCVGKSCPRRGEYEAIALNLGLCLEAVNESLRRQGRPPVTATHQALHAELRAEGRLLGPDNSPFQPGDGSDSTYQTRIGGSNLRCIRVSPNLLLSDEISAPAAAQ